MATDTATKPTSDIQYRYIEMRYDGDRTISGTLVDYADVAEFPWGDKERFEPGAFGDVGSLDIILHKQHERSDPIARSGDGTFMLTDSGRSLELRANIIDTTVGEDTIKLVRAKILRGLSVEFIPLKTRLEGSADGGYVHVIEKAELRGAGVVDRPQYKKSTLREELIMDEKRMQEMVDDAIAKFREELTAMLEKQRSEQTTTALTFDTGPLKAELDAFGTALRSEFKAQVEDAVREFKPGDGKDDDPDEEDKMMDDDKKKKKMEADAAEAAADIEVRSQERADLIVKVRSLVTADYDFKGKSAHDILVSAAGEEVEGAANRSEDYLLAKVEAIIERRATVDEVQRQFGKPNGVNSAVGNGSINITRLVEQKRMAAK